jgi:hypothetical protein
MVSELQIKFFAPAADPIKVQLSTRKTGKQQKPARLWEWWGGSWDESCLIMATARTLLGTVWIQEKGISRHLCREWLLAWVVQGLQGKVGAQEVTSQDRNGVTTRNLGPEVLEMQGTASHSHIHAKSEAGGSGGGREKGERRQGECVLVSWCCHNKIPICCIGSGPTPMTSFKLNCFFKGLVSK